MSHAISSRSCPERAIQPERRLTWSTIDPIRLLALSLARERWPQWCQCEEHVSAGPALTGTVQKLHLCCACESERAMPVFWAPPSSRRKLCLWFGLQVSLGHLCFKLICFFFAAFIDTHVCRRASTYSVGAQGDALRGYICAMHVLVVRIEEYYVHVVLVIESTCTGVPSHPNFKNT